MTEIVENNQRFSDDGQLVYDFNEEFLVICPKCASMAKVIPFDVKSEDLRDKLFAPRKLICLSCVHRATYNGKGVGMGGSVDWYFKLPLWLQISCCGEILWAYNLRHLEFIEKYVAAKLRERKPHSNKSMASRLPNWIKSAKNRDEVLKGIGKLREKLNGKS